jgi:DNA-binding NtrC family response regulator
MPNRVLLVEDDRTIRFGVARHLERSGFVVAEASSCEAARERFRAFDPEAVLTDFRLPDGEALELITDFRREKPTLPIFVVTGYASIELAVRAVKTGAHNLLTKPLDLDRLVDELQRACRATAPVAAEPAPSPVFLSLREEVERLKNVDCSLLILGETGTGKTRLARWLHDASRRGDKPFVDLNCAGLAKDLVESELFGHERGAFTSAHATKPGMLELADGGTLFLDEIGDIDLAVQPKVLKAIEEKRFRRMGSGKERSVDVRVVAATHCDLRDAARAGRFRADLYYRLATVTITMPPLRDRREEVPALAREILSSLSAKMGRGEAPDLSPEAEALLVGHAWPGNIRELKNVLERALHFTPGGPLLARDLQIEAPASATPPPGEVAPPASKLRDIERAHIERALAQHGHVGEAARSLGISRSSLYLKLKAYGITPPRTSSVSRLKIGADDA